MDIAYCIGRLDATGGVIRALCEGIDSDESKWKPTPERWALVEIISHLVDEERDDFRRRLDLILHHPGEEWPPIDPEGWAVERRYVDRDLAEMVAAFREERARSLEWLRGLGEPDWSISHESRFGRMSAGDMMSAWMAHDLLHIRQITAWHWAHLNARVAPFATEYAGTW